jgi:hypothetical protein
MEPVVQIVTAAVAAKPDIYDAAAVEALTRAVRDALYADD